MKYKIDCVDELLNTIENNNWKRIVAQPDEATWFLKRKIRMYKAYMILVWKADAIKYSKHSQS